MPRALPYSLWRAGIGGSAHALSVQHLDSPYAYPNLVATWDWLDFYLGDQFSQELTDLGRLRRFLDRECAHLGPRLCGSSIGYLYDLTFFHRMNAKECIFKLVIVIGERCQVGWQDTVRCQ